MAWQMNLSNAIVDYLIRENNYMNFEFDLNSLTTYFCKPMFNDIEASPGASCFFYRKNNIDYLITNWHVVTGKNAEDGICLNKTTATVPNKLRVDFFKCENGSVIQLGKNASEQFFYDIPLLSDEGIPLWLEYDGGFPKVDVVALPVNLNFPFLRINEKNASISINYNEERNVSAGDDVFVIGYPLGIKSPGNLPIWKRASVASEPIVSESYDKPYFLIDTASREGMSGSPVIFKKNADVYNAKISGGKIIFNQTKILLGVYSGRLGVDKKEDPQDLKAQLGIVWPQRVIDEIIDDK